MSGILKSTPRNLSFQVKVSIPIPWTINVRSNLPLSLRKTSFSKKHGILSAEKGICMCKTYLSMGFLQYLIEGKALREQRPNANGRLGEEEQKGVRTILGRDTQEKVRTRSWEYWSPARTSSRELSYLGAF